MEGTSSTDVLETIMFLRENHVKWFIFSSKVQQGQLSELIWFVFRACFQYQKKRNTIRRKPLTLSESDYIFNVMCYCNVLLYICHHYQHPCAKVKKRITHKCQLKNWTTAGRGDEDVSLSWIMHTSFPPQNRVCLIKWNQLAATARGKDSGEEQPGHPHVSSGYMLHVNKNNKQTNWQAVYENLKLKTQMGGNCHSGYTCKLVCIQIHTLERRRLQMPKGLISSFIAEWI